MSDQPTLEEFTHALEDLPPEFKAQLAAVVAPAEEVDTVAVKLELVKFTTELRKHKQLTGRRIRSNLERFLWKM